MGFPGAGLDEKQSAVVSRSRLLQSVAALAVIGLGLLSRSHRVGLPWFWAKYSGDALWALLVFLLFGLLFPRRSSLWLVGAAFLYSCATEFSQLYHAPWIDALRHNPIGHLILGDTFAWADIAAYAAGIALAAACDTRLNRPARTGKL